MLFHNKTYYDKKSDEGQGGLVLGKGQGLWKRQSKKGISLNKGRKEVGMGEQGNLSIRIAREGIFLWQLVAAVEPLFEKQYLVRRMSPTW